MNEAEKLRSRSWNSEIAKTQDNWYIGTLVYRSSSQLLINHQLEVWKLYTIYKSTMALVSCRQTHRVECSLYRARGSYGVHRLLVTSLQDGLYRAFGTLQ